MPRVDIGESFDISGGGKSYSFTRRAAKEWPCDIPSHWATAHKGSQMSAGVEAQIVLAPHEKEMLELRRGKPLSKDEMRRFES